MNLIQPNKQCPLVFASFRCLLTSVVILGSAISASCGDETHPILATAPFCQGGAATLSLPSPEQTRHDLELLSTMAHVLEQAYGTEQGKQDEIDRHLDTLTLEFWGKVYRGKTAVSASHTESPQTIFHLSTKDRIDLDFHIVDILFKTSGTDLNPQTFATILAHALNGLFDLAKSTVHMHDLATEVGGSPPEKTELSEIISLLAALSDPDALRQEIRSVSALRQSWLKVFLTIHEHHSRFQELLFDPASCEEEGVPPTAEILTPLSSATLRLNLIIQQSRIWRRNKDTTGIFTQEGHKEVKSGFEPGRVERWAQDVEARTAQLENDVKTGREMRRAMLQHLDQKLADKRLVAENEAHQRKIEKDTKNTRRKLDQVLSATSKVNESPSFQCSFTSMLEHGGFDPETLVQVGAEVSQNIFGSDAQPGNYACMTTFATGTSIEVQGDDSLNISVEGQYIADQILRNKGLGSGSLTGPQGYFQAFQHQCGHGKVESTSRSDFRSSSNTNEAYADGGIVVSGGFKIFGNGVEVHASTGVRSADITQTTSQQGGAHQQSSSEEQRWTETFLRPLLSDSSPFPTHAVGALLLLQQEDGYCQSIQTLDTSNQIQSKVNGKISFVVNDASNERKDSRSSSPYLTVRVRKMRSLAQLQIHVCRAMQSSLDDLDAHLRGMTRTTLAAMSQAETQTRAIAAVNAEGIRIEELPEAWRNLFAAHVCYRRANFEREVYARDLRETLGTIELEREALSNDKKLISSQMGLLARQVLLLDKGFENEEIRERAHHLVLFLQTTLVPFLQLSNHGLDISTKKNIFPRSLSKMVALPARESLHEVGFDFFDNLSGLVSCSRELCRLANEVILLSPQQRAVEVYLHIPRPGTNPARDTLLFPQEECVRIWDAIGRRQAVSFVLHPSHLYREGLCTGAALDLQDNLPLIDAMTIHFTTGADISSEVFNKSGFAVNLSQGTESIFVRSEGNRQLLTKDSRWKNPRIPLTCGFVEDAGYFHEQRIAGARGRSDRAYSASGMSPFARWSANFTDCPGGDGMLKKVLDNASSMTLMFTMMISRGQNRVEALP